MPFINYTRAGFATELLPILPHDARINRASPSFADLEGSKGKVPGRKVAGGTWFGFAEWSRHVPSAQDIKDWAGWGSGIGLQGRKYPGLDIDVENREVADAIETTALLEIGLAPARFGRGSRRLLVYAGAGLKKRRLAFRLPGRPSDAPAGHLGGADDGQGRPGQDQVVLDQERAEDLGVLHAVELLGEGQQYVVEGIHPKTGQPYAWRGPGLAEIGSEALTPVTDEEIDAFFAALEWAIVNIYDGEIVKREHDRAGQGTAVWQDGLRAPSLEAVRRALEAIENNADYDQWIDVMVAVKSATDGSEEGFELFAEWSSQSAKDAPEVTRAKWDSFHPPYRLGWPQLARSAREHGFNAAAEEFEPVEQPEQGDGGQDDGPVSEFVANHVARLLADHVSNMKKRYAWVESAKRVVHLETGALLDQEQFEFRVPPDEKGRSAWKLFKDNPVGRIDYSHLTCRFGGPREVFEDLPDLQGRCLNIWRPPARKRPIPERVSDTDVQPWLDLARHVIPIDEEREHALSWMACTAQRQDVKVNHALVLGSRIEGIGKDTLLEPLRAAIGRRYVKEIGPQHLAGNFNAWAVGAKLVIVQEMHNFERKETMNRLKPYVAAPPEALAVNLKNRQEFYVPNLMSMVFCTNEDDALALSKGDRRYFITWNDGEPLPQERYAQLWDWLKSGGTEKVIGWLMQRDLSAFDHEGRAPMTAAKLEMREAARTPLQEWLEDSIAQEELIFARDLVTVEEIAQEMPEYVKYRGQPPSTHKIAKALRAIGAERVSDKIRIEGMSGSRRIWAIRKAALYRDEHPATLRDLYLKQKAEARSAEWDGVDRKLS